MLRGVYSTAVLFLFTLPCRAETTIQPTRRFDAGQSKLAIVRAAEANKPFSVAGEFGGIFGEQSGNFEAWIFPLKILSHVRITARLADYPIPIELSALSASIEVDPEQTVITYSHAAFTVKQHMFVPRHTQAAEAPVVFFEISSIRPLDLVFTFTPEVLRMWPAPNYGLPNAEWVKQGDGGYYILHTDNNEVSAGVTIPHAKQGILAPYQERPKTWPVELHLHFDPKTDQDVFFPLLMTAGKESKRFGEQLSALNERIPALYRQTCAYYDKFFDDKVVVDTPDQQFNLALRWAMLAIDQLQVRYHDETGMVAGYYSSADSARPGFGWFFGRDTMWTLYAVNSYGDFALTKRALEFLSKRQREDGKMMHEFSQTADMVDWKKLPYLYASADATPLYIMIMEDYVKTSGDVEFLKAHWPSLQRAYQFMLAHDSDGDGFYENTEGTGWVESWPPTMPHQEIYLAALCQQAAGSLARMADFTGDQELASKAKEHAERMRNSLAKEYFQPDRKSYAFSRNADGSVDKTASVYPAVAWWDGTLKLPDAEPMLSKWASHEFATDWGMRDVSERESIYDPISYHQGSVWPLFTGWASLAQYRAGCPLAGYASMMQNANLTYAQDLGAVTELLSGAYFQPLGRSSSHQLWSSAMVLSPALRGMLGLEVDATKNQLRLNPQIPATWNHLTVQHVAVGKTKVDLEITRNGAELAVLAKSDGPIDLCLASHCEKTNSSPARLLQRQAPVEVFVMQRLPAPGDATAQLKAIEELREDHRYRLTLEGQGGTAHHLPVLLNRKGVKVAGATLANNELTVQLPSGPGYQQQTIEFTW